MQMALQALCLLILLTFVQSFKLEESVNYQERGLYYTETDSACGDCKDEVEIVFTMDGH